MFKRKAIVLISILLVMSFFAACGDSIEINDSTENSTEITEVNNHIELPEDTIGFGLDTTNAVPSTILITGWSGTNITTEKRNTTTTETENTTTTQKTKKSETISTTSADSFKSWQDSLFASNDPSTAAKVLEFAGFQYDPVQGIYFSTINPLQRNFGFNPLYDRAAPYIGMIYLTKRIFFTCDNRDWMIQIWKGQYGITVGAEIGIYNKPVDRQSEHYDCVGDEDMVEMAMLVYKNDELYFSRGPEKHWWLTGFKLLDVTTLVDLRLSMIITFDAPGMGEAFENSLKALDDEEIKWDRVLNTFFIEL